jgi:separase
MSTGFITDLRARLEKVFKRILPPPDKKQKQPPRLSDVLLDCFSSLSPKCREEELEDLLFFILDLYTFHGIPVAIADIDVDQVTVDLRCALEEHAAFKNKRGKVKSALVDDPHMFLVLDHNVQGVPWESIPVLRGQSVSRIPNVSFLLDRVRLASAENRSGGVVDRTSVDPRKTFFVLNPSGDLKGTEGRFKPWLEQMRSVGWEGVIGRPPSEQQILDALARKDLVVYFGHGGGEQYVRSHKIRHLPRCAATMLWGCSSGSLREMGEFDRVGTPFNYMLAGCPLLVANLWDVTDRDIDKFSQAVFDSLRLTPTRGGEQGMSAVTAIAQAREVCKLKYLTGAAPVVYGIPFYL